MHEKPTKTNYQNKYVERIETRDLELVMRLREDTGLTGLKSTDVARLLWGLYKGAQRLRGQAGIRQDLRKVNKAVDVDVGQGRYNLHLG